MKNMLALALIAVLSSGCAAGMSRSQSDRTLDKYEPYIGAPIRQFTAFRTDSWQPVNRNQLIVWTGVNNAYLLTIVGGCPDLMFSNTVRVTTSASSISTHDSVLVERQRCPIQRIQPIDIRAYRDDRDARERAAARN